MTATLHHRGPDDNGIWVNPHAGVALGHARLAIIDLTPAGHQPMLSQSGRYTIVFNGEIYNFQAIATELRRHGVVFRGHSDTEVLLAAVECWGLTGTLTRATGMFALAIWDNHEQVLHLARDRMGEKPLYYGWRGDTVLFASELKALRAYSGWRAEVDSDALGRYLRLGYIPAPHSIYRGIYKLPPGTSLSIPCNPARAKENFSPDAHHHGNASIYPKPFWSVTEVARAGIDQPFLSDTAAIDELEELLRSVVRDQMIADVPLGAFLSGGIDSSAVVALMQAESTRPVKTFAIGFDEQGFNEAEHAKKVALHLGTEHTELYVTANDALATVPSIAKIYDEPFADSSQIPTILVSKLARRHVTVALSGDGGDELFAGYNRYRLAQSVFRLNKVIPRPLRQSLGGGLLAVGPERWDRILGNLRAVTKNKLLRQPRLGSRFCKFAGAMQAGNLPEIYQYLVSYWTDPQQAMVNAASNNAPWLNDQEEISADPIARMLLWDQNAYLPDDHLVRVDRASMSTALEVRTPLLDHRVVEFSWRLPTQMKLNNGVSKWILRQVLFRHVPRGLIERPKMGFSVPIEQWLRGALRDWAEDLLSHERLTRDGIFHPRVVRDVWKRHLSGATDAHHELWAVLMFQAWLDEQSQPTSH